MRGRSTSIVMCSWAALASAGSGVEPMSAQTGPAPADWLAPCSVAGVGSGGWCGTYEVYEDRQAQTGRRIGLNVLVLPALARDPKPDPIFYFAGGPGAAATDAAAFISRVLARPGVGRDLVFVDQRGTGRSSPLDCPTPDTDGPPQPFFDELFSPHAVRECLARHGSRVLLYTTPNAVDDIDEIREALRYDRVNILGGSYGTRAALVYLRTHSDHVRTAVLHGVAPTDMKNPLEFAQNLERGLRRVFQACAAEVACHRAFPDLERDWATVVGRFADGSITAEVEYHGRRETIEISRGVFGDGIRHILYSIDRAAGLPRLIHAAARGDFSQFVRQEIHQQARFADELSYGMFLTVTCAEDIQFITDLDIVNATEGTFLGDYRVRRQRAACEIWGAGDVDARYLEPVAVETPTLLISGEWDPATSPAGGERVARTLPNSKHVVFPNKSHDYVNFPCITRIIADVIETGTVDGLDASCAAGTRRPPFLTHLVN